MMHLNVHSGRIFSFVSLIHFNRSDASLSCTTAIIWSHAKSHDERHTSDGHWNCYETTKCSCYVKK